MSHDPVVVLRIDRRTIVLLALLPLLFVALLLPGRIEAQKSQENFKDKLDITAPTGGIAVAASADGKFVYVAGPSGVMVSDDFGKTGSWTQTARLK
jgi:hypothetical protein